MRKTRTGVVVSAHHPTLSVRVDRMVTHPKYGKRYRVSKKFAVHDPKGLAKVGDTVQIVEVPPISKTKSWKVQSVVTSAVHVSEIAATAAGDQS